MTDDPRPRQVFDPESPEMREQLAADAYHRQLQLDAAREAELSGDASARYALGWKHLPRERQEIYRAAVDALVSLIEVEPEES